MAIELSLDKDERLFGLLGENLRGDCKGEEFIVSIVAGRQDREHICAGSLRSANDGSKQAVLLKIKVFKPAKICVFDVKHAQSLCCGRDNLLSSRGEFCLLRGWLG